MESQFDFLIAWNVTLNGNSFLTHFKSLQFKFLITFLALFPSHCFWIRHILEAFRKSFKREIHDNGGEM